MVKVVIGTKVCSFEELIEEYSRVCEENEELRKQISELESELSVEEDLLKIKSQNKLSAEEQIKYLNSFDDWTTKEPLPFSDEQYEEDLIEELEDRHQQDCITINQLHTTIDTLVDRYAKLREMRGL